MKIYTRTGDKGETSLIGGTRVPKDHYRIEAYGTIDELNSYIGLVKDSFEHEHTREILGKLQDRLFSIGSHLAADPERSRMVLPQLNEADLVLLEQEIDRMDMVLPALKNFILPGGHPIVSYCHIARCVCRRAERATVKLDHHEKVEPIILHYLNRLSDYLFVLARFIGLELKTPEINWKPMT
jgi:cob(I)alamin adenosyltransferase